MTKDRYRTLDKVEVHKGEAIKRQPAPKPTLAQRQIKAEARAAEGALAMAEIEEREKAKRANMERLKAERLARGGA